MPADEGRSYHEAAHVVAAAALGLRFHRARLADAAPGPADPRGSCRGAHLSIPSRYRFAAVVPLAGAVAERRYAESRGRPSGASWWEDVQERLPERDRREANRLISSALRPLSEGEAELYLRALASRTRVLVDNWWPAITVLAEELAEKRELSRREVRRLLTPWPTSERGDRGGGRRSPTR